MNSIFSFHSSSLNSSKALAKISIVLGLITVGAITTQAQLAPRGTGHKRTVRPPQRPTPPRGGGPGTPFHGNPPRTGYPYGGGGYGGGQSNPPRTGSPYGGGFGGGRSNPPVTRYSPPRVYIPVRTVPTYTVTSLGRVYTNGVTIRIGSVPYYTTLRPYFASGYSFYPYYVPSYGGGAAAVSPYGYFYGSAAPFINPDSVVADAPAAEYVDVPTYDGNLCSGYQDSDSENWLTHDDLADTEPGLLLAIEELTEAITQSKIDMLVSLIDPNVQVAVYLKGKYRYSLAGGDYVDLSRDAISNTKTIGFDITSLRKRADGVFCASGTQTYKSKAGKVRVVYVSYVFEQSGNKWILTQVGSAPDVIQKWEL